MSKSRTRLLLQKQPVWGLAIGALFLVDFVSYGYMPSHRRLQSLAQARRQHEQVINTATAQAEALPALAERHKETARMVRRYEDCVPSESALGVFLGQIANIMTQHQLTDQVVEPGQETKADELNCIPVHLNGTGTLDTIFGFFDGLESLHRLVRIERIILLNDSGFTGAVSMQAEAVIFYRPQAAQEADASVSKRSSEVTNDDA